MSEIREIYTHPWKRIKRVQFVEQTIAITALLLGVIGQMLLILSLFFPWRSNYSCDLNKGCYYSKISFSYFFYGEFNSLSFLIESVFGLMITIGLFIIWWRKQTQIFSSLITLGILILPVKIFVLLLFFIKFGDRFSYNMIPEIFVRDCWNDIGAYMNLTATIFLIIMVGISILGLFLRKNKKNTSRVYDIKDISAICLFSLLVITPSFFEWVSVFPHIYIILIAITLLLTSFIRDDFSRNTIIPLFIMILGIEILVPYLPFLQHPSNYEFRFNIFLMLQTAIILIVSGQLLFKNGSMFKSKALHEVGSHDKRIRILNPLILLKFLSGIIVILLVYCLGGWFLSETSGRNLVLKINPQRTIFLGILAPLLLLTILYSSIYVLRNKRLIAYNRKSGINFIFPFIYFVVLVMYIYILFYVFFFASVPVGIKEVFDPFNRGIVSLFIIIYFVPIFCFIVILSIYLNVLKIKEIKKRISVVR